jgi:peptidylprolyl isomerase
MKSKLQLIAAAACLALLTACGGGTKTTSTNVVPPQPDYKLTTTVVGSGLTAEAGDTVTVHYVGYLYDSTKADGKGSKVESSIDAGTPLTGTVGVGALPSTALPQAGWDLALLGMQPGGKRTAVLPYNLAYGSAVRDKVTLNGIEYAAIPTKSALVYDFTMINVTKAVVIPSVPPPTTLTTTDTVVGTGTAVVSGKTVTVRYAGWLYDGTRANRKGPKFDDNLGTSDAVYTVTAGGTGSITGFSTGIIGMQVGGTRTVIIPPDLGYGATAQAAGKYGVGIPANSTLIFEITLVSIQ